MIPFQYVLVGSVALIALLVAAFSLWDDYQYKKRWEEYRRRMRERAGLK